MTAQNVVGGRARRARPRLQRFRTKHLIGYIFIAPWLISFLLFDLIPIFSGFYHSFTKWNALGSEEFIG